MADNDHSAALVKLRGITPTAATAATAGEQAAAIHKAAGKLAALLANRAEFFVLVESLELLLGREVNELALQCCLDGDHAGRAELSDREALAILSTAAPLRAFCGRK